MYLICALFAGLSPVERDLKGSNKAALFDFIKALFAELDIHGKAKIKDTIMILQLQCPWCSIRLGPSTSATSRSQKMNFKKSRHSTKPGERKSSQGISLTSALSTMKSLNY